jgi:hypothetical protein
VAASKPSCPSERITEHGLDSAAGTVPQGVLVGRNAAGYFVNAGDSVSLTEIGLNTSPSVTVNANLGHEFYKVAVERGIVVPMKIATLSTDAAARAQYGKPVYAAYNNEVQLSRGTYENFVGFICGHNSVTEVLVYIPIAPAAGAGQGVIDFSRVTPGAETDGSLISTGNNWIAFSTASSCGMKVLLSYTCATGEFASWRVRARSNSVAAVQGINCDASAGQNDFGDLFGVQAFASPNAYTQSRAAGIVCALYARVAQTGVNNSRTWVSWIDTHMTVKSTAASYLMRLSHNGTVANDGVFTIYNGGRMPVLFNFEDVAGCVVEAAGTYSTADGYFTVKTSTQTYRVPMFLAVD